MSATGLRRALTRWDLTALGINQVLGGAVFLMPALVAAQLGNWSIWAVPLVGLLAMCVALCFAEAGSRFDGTGGAALYVHEAFGRFAGFEVGWMLWVVRTHELGLGRQRPRRCARLLLAGASRGLVATGAHHRARSSP